MNFQYFMPSRIVFGSGSLNQLATLALPGKKALIVISSGKSMKNNGYLDRVRELLKENSTDSVVFDKIQPNPTLKHVMEGAELARSRGCDFVIGLGGGSSIDSAKSIAVMAKNPGDYWDYISGGSGKGQPVKNGALPIVAITTTAGTGTEADPWTVVTKEETGEKIGFGNDDTFPTLSIVDPEIMLSVPAHLTAYQGFDAFFHASEGYIAKCSDPFSDLYALKSIELIAKWLPLAVKDGSNREARENVALANTLAGFVESTSSCTSEHSMEHALSAADAALPHGAGLIMLSESYHRFFQERTQSERYTQMAKAMGEDTDALPEKDRPAAFITALLKMQKACGVDQLKMSDYKIPRDQVPALAQKAWDTMGGLFEVDPVKLTLEETVFIMERAYR